MFIEAQNLNIPRKIRAKFTATGLSSVSNLSLQSEVPTVVFGGEPIASPVNCGSSGECAVGKAIKWYAVRKSINGRSHDL